MLKTEGALQRYFKAACVRNGILWRKIRFEGRRGCPDNLIAYEGRIVLVELKSPSKKGRLSALQIEQAKKFAQVGVKVRVADNQETVDEIIKQIKRPKSRNIRS